MSIFYINQEKNSVTEFIDKYDFAKFIDGSSDASENTAIKVKIFTGLISN